MTAYFTVVYTVRDEDTFRRSKVWKDMHTSMSSADCLRMSVPFYVSAMSHDHEMKRVNLMEEALERYGHGFEVSEAIKAIAQCPDLSEWSWEKFENEDE